MGLGRGHGRAAELRGQLSGDTDRLVRGTRGIRGLPWGKAGLNRQAVAPKPGRVWPLCSLLDSRPWEPCFSPQNSLEGKSQFQGKPSKG